MTLIWWLIVLLLLPVMVLVVTGWREINFSPDTRDQLNTDYYYQQATALTASVNGCDKHQQPAMLRELDQRLLADVLDRQYKIPSSVGRWSLLPGVILLLVMTPLPYLQVNGAGQWLQWTAMTKTYRTLRNRLLNPAEPNLTESELVQFAIGLRQSLALHPNDGANWGMYARLSVALNQLETSRWAFERAEHTAG